MKQYVSKKEFFTLQRMIEGDEHAFKYFFDAYYDELCNFVHSYLRDEALSEEIVQGIFVYFWERKDSLQLTGSVKSYLFAASKYKSLNYLRNLKNQSRIAQEFVLQSETLTAGADQYLEVEELKRVIGNAIESLPPKCKMIYRLSRDGEMTNREIAEELGITAKTVENQVTIAIKKIREFLQPYYEQLFILFFILSIA